MLESLSSRFKDIFASLGKKAVIEEKDLEQILKEVRIILLESDVALGLVKEIAINLKENLLNKTIFDSVAPKQVVLKSLHSVLMEVLEHNDASFKSLNGNCAYYMFVGLQGSGKTTSCAKIAYHLKNKLRKKVLLVSLDFTRPAAYEQLYIMAKEHDLDFFDYKTEGLNSLTEVLNRLNTGSYNKYDMILLDTAGRMSVDKDLMTEMDNIYKAINPQEVLLVVDAMMGQSALQVAKEFDAKTSISGLVISKADADSRGGSIISAKYITHAPIKFMGIGEKITDSEVFVAKSIVDRILDQGDVLSLLAKIEDLNEEDLMKTEAQLAKGLFTLEDFKNQLLQIKKLGGAKNLFGMLPGMSGLKNKINAAGIDEKIVVVQIAIIDSMTPKERKNISLLNYSRKQRIASGSGSSLQAINKLLKQHVQMQKVMKKFKNSNISNMKDLSKIGLDKFLR